MNQEKAKIKNFRDLDVWKLGMEIGVDVYQLTKSFPHEEMYGLVSQLKRSSLSIPSNVSEGFNRYHNKEYKQFLYIAIGSCAELETQIEASRLLGFMKKEMTDKLLEKLDHEGRMIKNLIKCL
jgi:four helix bundle protein